MPKCSHCSNDKNLVRVAAGKVVVYRCPCLKVSICCPACYGELRDVPSEDDVMRCIECSHTVDFTTGASLSQLKLPFAEPSPAADAAE